MGARVRPELDRRAAGRAGVPDHRRRLRAAPARAAATWTPLDRLARTAHYADDRILLTIATARCLLADDRPADAAVAARPAARRARRRRLGGRRSGWPCTASSRWPTRPCSAPPSPPAPAARGGDALGRYAAALEGELWALHEAGISALRSHCENHRLSRAHGALTREHGAVTAQLLEDPLTGLPNRRALDLRLAEATSEANQPCAVALVDLDRFKDVNDGRSHAVGDVVLREIAATLRRTLRAEDVVARYGGDEFVVIMPSTPLPDAIAALNRATLTIAELPREVASGVTMSVGVVGAGRTSTRRPPWPPRTPPCTRPSTGAATR